MTQTTEATITRQQLIALQREAAMAGDAKMCMIAGRALSGYAVAITQCVIAINDAEAQMAAL